jgi:hypothetical protein
MHETEKTHTNIPQKFSENPCNKNAMPTQQNFRLDAAKFLSRRSICSVESQQNFRRVAAVAPSRRKFNIEFIKKFNY